MTYVANGVLRNINAVLEDTLGSWLAWCRSTAVGNDLVWCGLDVVLGVVVEELLILLPVIVLPLVLPVFLAVLVVLLLVVLLELLVTAGLRGGSSDSDGTQDSEECCGGEMHRESMYVDYSSD
jgi:hypothetical protein